MLRLNKVLTFLFLAIVCLFYACNIAKKSEEVALESQEDQLNKLYEADRFKEVVSLVKQMLQQDSTDGELFFKRGFAYMQLDEYELSERDFNQTIKLKYRLPHSYYNLALIKIATYSDSLALHYLRKSLTYNPNFKEAKELLRELEN